MMIQTSVSILSCECSTDKFRIINALKTFKSVIYDGRPLYITRGLSRRPGWQAGIYLSDKNLSYIILPRKWNAFLPKPVRGVIIIPGRVFRGQFEEVFECWMSTL